MNYETNLRVTFTWSSPDDDTIVKERLRTLESIATADIAENWDKGQTDGIIVTTLFNKRYYCKWRIVPLEVFQ